MDVGCCTADEALIKVNTKIVNDLVFGTDFIRIGHEMNLKIIFQLKLLDEELTSTILNRIVAHVGNLIHFWPPEKFDLFLILSTGSQLNSFCKIIKKFHFFDQF